MTVISPIRSGKTDSLKELLGSIHDNRERAAILPFDEMPELHFARFFVIDETKDLDGNPLAPKLAYLANIDAPQEAHFETLVERGSEGLDRIYELCEAYPAPGQRNRDTRLAFLRKHRVKTQAFYVNGIGRSVKQIRQEAELREAIENFLDGQDWRDSNPAVVRAAVQDYVRREHFLAWALSPAQPPTLSFRLKEALDLILHLLLALLLLPLILMMTPFFLILLRYHEERDVPDRSAATKESIRAARADEDFGVQNQIIAIGHFKRGLFRQITAAVILRVTNWALRHYFVHGKLSGLSTIHFARWVRFDGRHRMFFVSNYDGSLEAYQNDFIDLAASGLNAIFSSGDGFPYTRFLHLEGIRDEQAYKRFLPTRQIPSQVWYSAYPEDSVININDNTKIRKDLFSHLDREATEEWLRLF